VPAFATVGARATEPVGVQALRAVAAALRKPTRPPRRFQPAKRRVRPRATALPAAFRESASIEAARLLMFGGKGGVGKTTCAAAAALHLAETQPERRFLLVSVDPAHSLADVLETRVSDAARRVAGRRNLDVRELDPSRTIEPIRAHYTASVDAMFDRVMRGSAVEAIHHRIVMRDLLDFAPPGLDELAAVLELVGLLGEGETPRRYDVIVLDTAPTGHALRLLEMPAAVREWTRTVMKILLKYQPVAGIGELGAALLQLSRGLGRLRSMLACPMEAQLIVVTRAAALPRAETARLLSALRRLGVRVPAIIANAVGAGNCTRCRAIVRQELRELESLRRLAGARPGSPALIAAPAAVPPPGGVPALEDWRRRWRVASLRQ
jgi:arsenite-transporting ATPase